MPVQTSPLPKHVLRSTTKLQWQCVLHRKHSAKNVQRIGSGNVYSFAASIQLLNEELPRTVPTDLGRENVAARSLAMVVLVFCPVLRATISLSRSLSECFAFI